MDRRSFFKLVGGAVAGAAVAPEVVAAPEPPAFHRDAFEIVARPLPVRFDVLYGTAVPIEVPFLPVDVDVDACAKALADGIDAQFVKIVQEAGRG